MTLLASHEIPIRIESEANNSDHWTKKRKRRKALQFFVRDALDESSVLDNQRHSKSISLPCRVVLTRIGRSLDYDNLVASFKYVRDEISEMLIPHEESFYFRKGKAIKVKGRLDADPRIQWEYKQQTKTEKTQDGFRIEIHKI